MSKRGRVKMSVKDYEQEAVRVGKCLVHPSIGVSRKIYQMRHGKIPTAKLFTSKLFVCHHCDNPKCILDRHHFLGTHNDNMADMTRKGRKVTAMNKPEVLARVSAAAKVSQNKPGMREKKSADMLKTFAEDPAIIVRISKSLRRYYKKPGSIEKHVEAMNRPGVRARQHDVQVIAQNRPEVRAKKSEAQRAVMMKPAMRKRNSAAQKIAQNKPDVCAKRLASITERWSKPAAHELACVAQNKPGVNARRGAAIKRTMALPKNRNMARSRSVLGWATRRRNGNA